MRSGSQKQEDQSDFLVAVLSDFDGTLTDFNGSSTVFTRAYMQVTNIESVVKDREEKIKIIEEQLIPQKIAVLESKVNDLILQVEQLIQLFQGDFKLPKQSENEQILDIERTLAQKNVMLLIEKATNEIRGAQELILAAKHPLFDMDKVKSTLCSARRYGIYARDTAGAIAHFIESCGVYEKDSYAVINQCVSELTIKVNDTDKMVNNAMKEINELSKKLEMARGGETYSYLNSSEETVAQHREQILANITAMMSCEEKPDGYKAFVLSQGVIDFIRQALADDDTKFVIISKNHRAYIEAVLKFNGFKDDDLNKMTIHDLNHGGSEKKSCAANVVLNDQRINKNVTTVLVLDDSRDESVLMYQAVKSFGFVYDPLVYQYNPGVFPFKDITEGLRYLQEPTGVNDALDRSSYAVPITRESRGGGLSLSQSGMFKVKSDGSNGSSDDESDQNNSRNNIR